MRVFKNRPFSRFAVKLGIIDSSLCKAVRDAERGLVSASLGGGLIKQRIARPGEGKSGGFRTLIVFRRGSRAVFIHGFAKSETDNILSDELLALKKLARELLSYSEEMIEKVVLSGALTEISCNEKAI